MPEKFFRRSRIATAQLGIPYAARRPRDELASIKRGYRRYAVLYDVIFGRILQPGRLKAIQSLGSSPGQRILEIGVGTGLSLAAYRRDVRVVGIDVSREMLEKAHRRARQLHLPQVEALVEMDAQKIKFPDRSFDAVVALYVMTVVPNPSQVAAELRRVCAAGGKIVVVGHFTSDRPLLYKIEKIFACLLRQIGLSSQIRLPHLIDAIGLSPVEVRFANLFGFWKVVSFRNEEA